MEETEAEVRIKRQIFELMDDCPFWAYLILKLRFKVDNTFNTIYVDAKGNVGYNEKWICSLNDSEIKGVLVHEICHIVFGHLLRAEHRNFNVWCISVDVAVNNLISINNEYRHIFSLPSCGFIPKDNQILIGKILLKDINKKSAEQLYDELNIPNKGIPKQKGFDTHKLGEGVSEKEAREIEEKWKEAVIEAVVRAKQIGKEPKGMDRLIGNILEPKIDWKTKILRFITNTLPYDFSYSKPNRKALSQGIYLPGVVKENVEIVVSIDTSGSIDDKLISAFASEVIGMCKAHNNIKITVLVHDSEVHEVIDVNNVNDFLSKCKMKGGGGTSHKCVIDYINKNNPACRLYISITDGYSDIESCYNELNCSKIIALSSDYKSKELEEYGEVVVIQ